MYRNCKKIILASQSPRRQQYLANIGLDYIVQAASVLEEPQGTEAPDVFVLRMAKEKAEVVSAQHPESWVISGDTVVCLGDKIIGKPVSEENAVELLMMLSGREHEVKTGFSVHCWAESVSVSQVVTTKVQFTNFTENVARAYLATGECMDKAGAYGIQGNGVVLVQSITGSYSNVVGLPLDALLEVLLQFNVIELCRQGGEIV